MKENGKIDKNFDLARGKKRWNIKLVVIPIVVGS